MINNITYQLNSSTLEQISRHLTACSKEFTPNLDTYIDIDTYSKKIKQVSIRFEAYENDTLVGLIAMYRNTEQRFGFLTNVSILPEYQSKGLAYTLLNSCKEYLRTYGIYTIKLEVYKTNTRAVNFYKKYGFTIVQTKGEILYMEYSIRDYNKEIYNTSDHKYAYNFDFDVMHGYMLKAFRPFFKGDNVLELGSFKGDFTTRLVPYFSDITCIDASGVAINEARKKPELASVKFYNSVFDAVTLPKKYDNIILTHVLEHIDTPVNLLSKINNEWLTDNGLLFLVCPNANAASRQIAVKMGKLSNVTDITLAEQAHGHRVTYTLDTLEYDAKLAGLEVVYRSGIFFKALANFQWDKLLQTDIINKEYLDGCYELGQKYPDLCSSIMLICKHGK